MSRVPGGAPERRFNRVLASVLPECMERCLRQGKKECPSCRRHVATRRSLRRDANFDAIIHALFPDLDLYEREQEATLASLDHEEKRA
eukprot:CAMPEP_0206054832 /NCGR_PEP_ID=MMETSP1466-20131121/38955_1 /ASSEMBLY_ACC=CAM_ASM_001126 /TAXON_ID=44452 /ORGANISM="Pavlova gyrans, Strain CCMP608" /LENGTH=87 /DNA_ID=CAMNT_0053430053 /DNA_START=20 /DNA_END=281 /DNA_ORIENTATION=+